MTTLIIAPADRRALRGLAHPLDPVVMIGQHGLTPAVLHEIDNALSAHELIKVRMQNDDRLERAQMLEKICDTLSCAPVQHLGKLVILFRPGKQRGGSGEDGHTVPPKKEKERPRHTDFPKVAPRRASKRTDTRPSAASPRDERGTAPPRRKARDDDAWSDLSPRVRQRIDPNYAAAPTAFDDGRRPRSGGNTRNPLGPRAPRSPGFGTGKKPAYVGSGTFGASGPAAKARRRLSTHESGETSSRSPADAMPTDGASAVKKAEPRFRWSERDSQMPKARTPRPTTHTAPKQSKRGLARDPKAVARQTRRRLRED